MMILEKSLVLLYNAGDGRCRQVTVLSPKLGKKFGSKLKILKKVPSLCCSYFRCPKSSKCPQIPSTHTNGLFIIYCLKLSRHLHSCILTETYCVHYVWMLMLAITQCCYFCPWPDTPTPTMQSLQSIQCKYDSRYAGSHCHLLLHRL